MNKKNHSKQSTVENDLIQLFATPTPPFEFFKHLRRDLIDQARKSYQRQSWIALLWSRVNAVGRLGISLVIMGLLVGLVVIGASLLPGRPSPSIPGTDHKEGPAIANFASTQTVVTIHTEIPQSPTYEATQNISLPDPFGPYGIIQMSRTEKLLLNSVKLNLTIPLPEHSKQVRLYRRQPETLSKKGANEITKQFGFAREVESRMGEAGNQIYKTFNDNFTINVYSTSPKFFVFGRTLRPTDAVQKKYTFDELNQMAKLFLKEYGLSTFSYRIDPVFIPSESGVTVAIVQVIDNIPLYHNDFNLRWSWITFDGFRKVDNLVYQTLQLVPDGQISIRSVTEVWKDLQAHRLQDKSVLHILDGTEFQGDPITKKATIDSVELVYLTANTNGMWVGSIPADHPMRIVQPVWRFSGSLVDGTPVEILAEAVASTSPGFSSPTQSNNQPTQVTIDPSQSVFGKITGNAIGKTVNLHGGPGALYDITGSFSVGQIVEVTGRNPNGDWLLVKAEGVKGWVYIEFIAVNNILVVPCMDINYTDCVAP